MLNWQDGDEGMCASVRMVMGRQETGEHAWFLLKKSTTTVYRDMSKPTAVGEEIGGRYGRCANTSGGRNQKSE